MCSSWRAVKLVEFLNLNILLLCRPFSLSLSLSPYLSLPHSPFPCSSLSLTLSLSLSVYPSPPLSLLSPHVSLSPLVEEMRQGADSHILALSLLPEPSPTETGSGGGGGGWRQEGPREDTTWGIDRNGKSQRRSDESETGRKYFMPGA